MRALLKVKLILTIVVSSGFAHAESLEETVCGIVAERVAFSLWRAASGDPNPAKVQELKNVTPVSHKTSDGRILRGYAVAPEKIDVSQSQSGFVLVAQGNAILADQLVEDLGIFAKKGYTAYIYDFRGYGSSQGKSRIKAIVSDYIEIFNALSQEHEGKHLLYGFSFGGVVLMNVIGSGAAYDRAVIDSTPGTVSRYGCPTYLDPINAVPTDAKKLLFVNGANDRVVTPSQSEPLLKRGEEMGAKVVRSPNYGHPFMDRDVTIARQRQELITRFLTTE